MVAFHCVAIRSPFSRRSERVGDNVSLNIQEVEFRFDDDCQYLNKSLRTHRSAAVIFMRDSPQSLDLNFVIILLVLFLIISLHKI